MPLIYPELDKKRWYAYSKKISYCLHRLPTKLNQLDLVDIWRIKNPDTRSFTWSQKSPRIFAALLIG